MLTRATLVLTLVLILVWLGGCSLKQKEPPKWVTPDRVDKEGNPCYPRASFTGVTCLPIVKIRL